MFLSTYVGGRWLLKSGQCSEGAHHQHGAKEEGMGLGLSTKESRRVRSQVEGSGAEVLGVLGRPGALGTDTETG